MPVTPVWRGGNHWIPAAPCPASQSSQTVNLRTSERPCPKGIREGAKEADADGCPAMASVHIPTHSNLGEYHQRQGCGRRKRKRREGEEECEFACEGEKRELGRERHRRECIQPESVLASF